MSERLEFYPTGICVIDDKGNVVDEISVENVRRLKSLLAAKPDPRPAPAPASVGEAWAVTPEAMDTFRRVVPTLDNGQAYAMGFAVRDHYRRLVDAAYAALHPAPPAAPPFDLNAVLGPATDEEARVAMRAHFHAYSESPPDSMRIVLDAIFADRRKRFASAPSVPASPPRPRVVCLCGSSRFFTAYLAANYRLTMQGDIVLSIGFFPNAEAAAHGELVGCTPEQKEDLDRLHLRKIDLADSVYVLDINRYVGESTRREIEYAEAAGKPVDYASADPEFLTFLDSVAPALDPSLAETVAELKLELDAWVRTEMPTNSGMMMAAARRDLHGIVDDVFLARTKPAN